MARAVQALERPWGWLAGGCHPNRDVVAAIATAGFRLLELNRFDFQIMPRWSAPTSSGWRSDPHPGLADQAECSSRFCPRTGPAWVDHPWITG